MPKDRQATILLATTLTCRHVIPLPVMNVGEIEANTSRKGQEHLKSMGGLISKLTLFRKKNHEWNQLNQMTAEGYFNERLAPTNEELQGSEYGNEGTSTLGNCEIFGLSDMEDSDRSMVAGRELRSDPRDFIYDPSKSTLENRRPLLYRNVWSHWQKRT